MRVPLTGDVHTTSDFVGACESAGFAGVGLNDHPESGLDPYVAAGEALRATARIEVYVAVTNVVTRHPIVLASMASSLAGLAPGRFRLVVGSGDMAVRLVGSPPTQLDALGASVTGIIELLNGRVTTFEGEGLRLAEPPSVRPQVLLACAGLRGLEVAGKHADGAFLVAPLSSEVANNIAQRTSDRTAFDVIRVLPVHVTDTLASGTQFFGRWWQSLASASPDSRGAWLVQSARRWASSTDFEIPDDLATASPDRVRRLADWIGLFGPPAYCRERLSALESEGVSRAYLRVVQQDAVPLPLRELCAFAGSNGTTN